MITINRGSKYKWSGHAVRRWEERLSKTDKNSDFATARLATKKQKALLKKLAPVNAKIHMIGFTGRYFLVSRTNVVYVIGSKGAENMHDIITVFRMEG